ncbi:3-beta hydroxysteroid dehydrogenase/isomerase [Planktothrix serta PCC 8927]|uniref:3-beta hydroxysteroid dehydrogenase/isomerase n=1 Tax=Planktothrix serta PCC 8927 TaxID=671068 RepID=A0A7Z9C4A6_9CYAN|nr:SDR family oxidoreductase [Planktothrix serta]VXD25672.1 3-beta hydroxysteroid dehydrogenase/isomerase [Planktothrix serta PCC 8927]
MFLVTGATGGLGRRIVQQLCDQEIPVRAFVRLSSRYAQLEHRGAQIFLGDLREQRDIEKACQGVQYIISTHSNPDNPLKLDYRANIDLIDVAKAANVKHFVFISVLGTDRGYEDSPIFKAKREVEKYLQSSGLNYTILRPSALASSLLPLAESFKQTGIYLLIGDRKNRTSVVSTDDVARIAIDSGFIEAANHQIFPVGGPEILIREDIYQIFSRVFNREPIVINPPLFLFDGLRGGLGLINSDLYQKLGTLRVLLGNEFFCTTEEIQNLELIFKMKMENLESFIRRYLAS